MNSCISPSLLREGPCGGAPPPSSRGRWRARRWRRCAAAWAFSKERRTDARVDAQSRGGAAARADGSARARHHPRRRDRFGARARREARGPPDEYPDLPRLRPVHEALDHHGDGERRPHPGGRADRHGRRVHRRRHDPARARHGGGADQCRHDLGGRGDRGRAGRGILPRGGRHHPARAPRAPGAGPRGAGRGAPIDDEPRLDPRAAGADGTGGAGDRGAPHGAGHRAAAEPPRECGPGRGLRAPGAQAAARSGDGGAAPPSRRPDRVVGGVTRRLVVDLASSYAAWRVPAGTVTAIREALGGGWEVVQVREPAVADGDGGSGSDEAVRVARGAEIYIGYGLPQGVAAAARETLRWVHTATAGVGASLPRIRGTAVVFTNSAAVHAEPIADWALAAVAYFARGLDRMREAQAAESWAREEFANLRFPVRELRDVRLGVFGLGGIGSAIARRARALGMPVAGVRRRPQQGGPPGVGWVGGRDDVPRLAAESDCLVIAAPHTAETQGAVDRGVLERLPRGAIVVNVSRGSLLDEPALLELLDAGQLRGAALDVFATEPLPPGHPLWRHPRVLVSPHVAAVTDRFWERETGLIVENLGRYLAGTPLANVVDPEAGY